MRINLKNTHTKLTYKYSTIKKKCFKLEKITDNVR